MVSRGYPKMLELLDAGTLSWTTDTINVMLVNDAQLYDRTHDFVADVVANEMTGTTRQTLAGKTSADNGVDTWIFDAADPVFTAVPGGQTLGAAIVFKQVTNDADSPLLAYLDPADIVANGSDMTITLAATGAFFFGY